MKSNPVCWVYLYTTRCAMNIPYLSILETNFGSPRYLSVGIFVLIYFFIHHYLSRSCIYFWWAYTRLYVILDLHDVMLLQNSVAHHMLMKSYFSKSDIGVYVMFLVTCLTVSYHLPCNECSWDRKYYMTSPVSWVIRWRFCLCLMKLLSSLIWLFCIVKGLDSILYSSIQ